MSAPIVSVDGLTKSYGRLTAVAEYAGCDGRRRVVCSNRICLCVPRFAVVRTELPLVRHQTVVQVRGNEIGPQALHSGLAAPLLGLEQCRELDHRLTQLAPLRRCLLLHLARYTLSVPS